MLGIVAVSLFLLLFLVVRRANMAKKKKDANGMGMCSPVAYKPPTTAQVIASESRYLGQRVAESHPKVKKVRDEIARAVEGAVKKVLSGQAKKIDG